LSGYGLRDMGRRLKGPGGWPGRGGAGSEVESGAGQVANWRRRLSRGATLVSRGYCIGIANGARRSLNMGKCRTLRVASCSPVTSAVAAMR